MKITAQTSTPRSTNSIGTSISVENSGNSLESRSVLSTRFDPLAAEASFESSSEAGSDEAFLELGRLRNGNAAFLNTNEQRERPNPSAFDEEFYLSQNPDVSAAVAGGAFPSGLAHYQEHGSSEGRNPNSAFDESYYLANNPDVAEAVAGGAFGSGFEHYQRHGSGENRIPSADYRVDGTGSAPQVVGPQPVQPGVQPPPGPVSAAPAEAAPVNPAERRDFIEDQLAQYDNIDTLTANISDDPQSFQALLDILDEDFNVVVRDLGERGNGPFTTGDLVNVANQLNNLPEHIIDDYLEADQSLVVTNGDFTLSQEFQDAHPPGLFERNEAGQVLGSSGEPVSGTGGVHVYSNAEGAGITFVNIDAVREDSRGNGGSERFDGSDSTILHELAHGLDNVGGDDRHFQEISHSAEFVNLVNREDVWSFLETIQNGDFHSDPANVEEHFAELFANYYASPETRALIPVAAQDFFANLDFQP